MTLVMLGLAEAALRVFGIGGMVVFTRHPDWGFLMTPSQTVRVYGHSVVINALGLRGPEVRAPKPPGGIRILFLGDSVTYGGGSLREEQLFVRRVESAARALGVDAETVNVSAPAWSPQNWARYVDARGLLGADILVVVIPECDFARPFATIESGGHQVEVPWFRIGSLVLKVKNTLARRPPLRSFARPVPKSGLQPGPLEDEIVAANLDALRRVRNRAGLLPMLTVMVPSPALAFERLWSRFKAEAGEVLDLRPELDDPKFFTDGVHLNARGHEIVGERIFSKMRSFLKAQTAGSSDLSAGGVTR